MNYIRYISGLIVLGVLLSPLTVRAEDLVQAPVISKPEELEQLLGLDTIRVLWIAVPDAVRYHYVLAKDRAFKEVLIDDRVGDTTAVTLQPVDYGTYFLKVSAVVADGREGPFSENVPFIVVPDPRPEDFSR